MYYSGTWYRSTVAYSAGCGRERPSEAGDWLGRRQRRGRWSCLTRRVIPIWAKGEPNCDAPATVAVAGTPTTPPSTHQPQQLLLSTNQPQHATRYQPHIPSHIHHPHAQARTSSQVTQSVRLSVWKLMREMFDPAQLPAKKPTPTAKMEAPFAASASNNQANAAPLHQHHHLTIIGPPPSTSSTSPTLYDSITTRPRPP